MEINEFKQEFVSGLTSVVIALVATFAASLAVPTQELQWALIAVGIASFFSGFFGNHFAEE